MIIELNRFWKTTPNIITNAIAFALISLGIGCGVAIGSSNAVKITNQGIEIQRQAYKNQVELEKAVEVIDTYEQSFAEVQEKATQKSRRNPKLQGFAEEVKEIKETVPIGQVQDIKLTILESKKVLEQDTQMEIDRNREDRRPDP